jgi:hypothetical protein
VGVQRHAQAALTPGKTNCGGGWVGPIVGLHGCGNSLHHRDSITGTAKIKNCLKVTNKHKTKNTVNERNNFMTLQYCSYYFFPPPQPDLF